MSHDDVKCSCHDFFLYHLIRLRVLALISACGVDRQRFHPSLYLFISEAATGFGQQTPPLVELQIRPDGLTPAVLLYTNHLFVSVSGEPGLGDHISLSQLRLRGGIGT